MKNISGVQAIRDDISNSENPEETKQWYLDTLQELADAKKRKCIRTNSKGEKYFDYLIMSQMYYNGEW